MIKIYIKNINEKLNRLELKNESLSLIYNILNIKKDEIIYNIKNKPYDKLNRCYFNISHSSSLISLATYDKEIGFDIEENKDINTDKLNKLKKKVYNINDYKSELPFIQIWTIKESYLKYLGIGLIINLDEIIIDYNNKKVSYKDYKESYFITNKYKNYYYSVNTDIIDNVELKEVN